MAEPAAVSLVVVTWNNQATIAALLRSARDQPPDLPYEILVIDNSSTDRTLDEIERSGVPVRLIRNDSNRGLAAALNQGLAAASGRRIVLCNPDIRFTAGALTNLRAAIERHPRAAFVVPRLSNEDGSLQTSAGNLPTLRQALWARRYRPRSAERQGFWWDGWAHDEELRIGHGAECCYAVRGEAVAAVGPLDERFWLDWEGIDWSARMAAAGWEIWFCPAAQVVHVGGGSVRQAPWRLLWHSHVGMFRYFRKHGRIPSPVLAVVVTLRGMAKAGLFLARRPAYGGSRRPEPPGTNTALSR